MDPAVLDRDFMAVRPHMAFTVYDEVSVALRRLTGLDFERVLTAQQLLFRALALAGVFLIASALGLGTGASLLAAAIFALGAVIGGPTVLTVEYEPVPRAFALPLLLLALGLIAHGRDLAGAAAASAAFLYHPPTTLAFWAVYFVLAAWPSASRDMKRRVLGLAPLLAAVVLLLWLSRLQHGVSQPPELLARIDPSWEKLLRLRGSYLWISLWFPRWFWHYGILWVVAAIALWRTRAAAPADLRFFLAGLPLAGAAGLAASGLLLEVGRLALGPQLQPARNVLFITLIATVLSSAAGARAAASGRKVEGFFWFLIAFAIPAGDAVQRTLCLGLGDPLMRRRALLAALLAAAAVAVAGLERAGLRWRAPAWAALLAAPFFLYPGFGKVINYPQIHSRGLDEVSRWARQSTPQDSVFLFPDARRELYPGVFRARALRAVYVDWKSGGQGIYLRSVGEEWWRRWHAVMARPYEPGNLDRFAALGIDYVAVRSANREPGRTPTYENPEFAVYRVR